MNTKNIKQFFAFLFVLFVFGSCSNWTEPKATGGQSMTDSNGPKSEQYYENLRAYKKTDHAIAFGWFSWSSSGGSLSLEQRMSNVPDSMDIISVWSKNYYHLTPEQKQDKDYVQLIKGIRVTFSIFAHNMVNGLPDDPIAKSNRPEDIPQYAKQLADSIYKYNYDGIDLDQESSGSDLFHDRTNFESLVLELRKDMPHKLILVDGMYSELTPKAYEAVDYAVAQAYGCSGDVQAEQRWKQASAHINPERFIITENFESYWSLGGVDYTRANGDKVKSLLGMALWNPKDFSGHHKGGFGAYHMEYDYANDPDYKYMRQAIQAQNRAKPN